MRHVHIRASLSERILRLRSLLSGQERVRRLKLKFMWLKGVGRSIDGGHRDREQGNLKP